MDGRISDPNRPPIHARARARHPRATHGLLLALLSAMLLALPILAGGASAAGHDGLVRLGREPRPPRGAVGLGPVASWTRVSGAAVLRPRDPTALTRLIDEVGRRGSPEFGKYLAKGQFASRFGPASADVEDVEAALRSEGLRIEAVAAGGELVRFSGTATDVAHAFATSLRRYRLRDGREARLATSAPAVPQALAGSVAAVVGLDELPQPRARTVRARANRRRGGRKAKAASFAHSAGAPAPCAAARATASSLGGLTDDQIANAYGASGLYALGDTGAGVHVGIFEQEPFIASDIEHFDSCYFGAGASAAMAARLHVIEVEGGSTEGAGEGEASLDVEDVSAIAPGADIDVYDAPESLAGELSEITAIIEEDRDQIITSSWGEPCEQEAQDGEPGVQQAESYLFQQAAAQGQTFMNAAGDTGSDSCEEEHRETAPQPGQNPVSSTEPTSQPYVLGVGGTTITNAATQPAQEHVWNDGPGGGAGGGGISQSFAMPSWQRDSLVPGISLPGSSDYASAADVEQRFGFPAGFCDATLPAAESSTPCRLSPDVSAQADELTGAPTFYSVAFKAEGGNGWTTLGGTSSASPIWAGMLALVDGSPTCRSNPATAAGVGFASPLLYGVASDPASYAASFNDITEGNNDIYGLGGGRVFPARTGFDLASGLGSPRLTGAGGSAGLAYYLCRYASQPSRPAVASLSPGSGTTAGGESVTLTGTGFQNAGADDVADVQVGAWHAAPGAITVLSDSALRVILPPARDTLPAGAPAPQDGAGAVDVVVTLTDGQSSAIAPATRFQYLDTPHKQSVPSITGLRPSGGSETAPAPVTILGAGFGAQSTVSFGGVAAATVEVRSVSEILATPAPYSPAVACAPLPSSGVYAGESASNDICQVQVVVGGATGASATGTILPPFEGAEVFEQDGALVAPLGCGCEVYPEPTEYDYAPAPSVTSVSTSAGPASLADETGETLVTLHGAGLNRLTFDYAFFGESGAQPSVDYEVGFASGTELQIAAPRLFESPAEASRDPLSVPFSVRTLAGDSAQTPVRYAGVPSVTAVENTASNVRFKGVDGAPDTGGAPVLVKGHGMLEQVAVVRFTDGEGSEGTNFAFSAEGDSRLRTQTVSQSPGLVDTELCTVTGCSARTRKDRLYLYPPGQPTVEALSPHSGSSEGGARVKIRGQSLGCAIAVDFGGVPAQTFSQSEGPPPCGSATTIVAIAPPGAAGATVPVTVTTLASRYTKVTDAPSRARFTFTGPPQGPR